MAGDGHFYWLYTVGLSARSPENNDTTKESNKRPVVRFGAEEKTTKQSYIVTYMTKSRKQGR